MYNNLMLLVLGYAESHNWGEMIVCQVMDRVLTLIPAFHHLCRPHIINAVRMYMISKDRQPHVRSLAIHFEALVVSLFRHGTCTSTLCEFLVNMAIVCYCLLSPTIPAKRSMLEVSAGGGWSSEVEPSVKEVSLRVQSFVEKHHLSG
jgi:hypothetical protein